jgi:sugar phosphate isomerase/epimerase
MEMLNRRTFIKAAGSIAATAAISTQAAAAEKTIGLGLGNYGLRAFSAEEGIKLIAKTGYDSVELTLMPGYVTEPVNVSASQRRQLQSLLKDLGLALPSLLEQIPITGDANAHKANLDRLRRDAQFGHDVNGGVGGVVPCVQTHLGGASKDWESSKDMMASRLRDWAEVGRETQTVIAFKGHNLNLNDTSDKTFWLIKQVNSPWLRCLYDYSHYQAAGEQLGKTMDLLIPLTPMISIKDGKNYTDKPGFERLLPGDGTIDYVDYYRRLLKLKYTGHTVVEISGQIHSRPGYDPVATAKRCYDNVAPAMAKAGVVRPKYKKT